MVQVLNSQDSFSRNQYKPCPQKKPHIENISLSKLRNMKYQDNQHFSHHHILKSLALLDESEELQCQACDQPIFEPFQGCISCNFYLHDNCLNAPRSLVHPCHPSHPLTLLPTPTYSSRSFICNACGSEGRSCSLSCAHCEFDLHVQCALLPQTVLLAQHRHHELKLLFDSPFDHEDESSIFVCDLCHGKAEQNYWLYYCADCDFRTHIECSTSNYVNRPKENVVITKAKEESIKKTFNDSVISAPTRNPVRKTKKKSSKIPEERSKMKTVTPEHEAAENSADKPEENEEGEGEENAVIMIKKTINEPVISTPEKSAVRKTEKKSAKNPRETPKMKTVSLDEKPAENSADKQDENEEGEENAVILRPKEKTIKKALISAPTKSPVRKTKKKSAKNIKLKPVSESAIDENSADKLPEQDEEEGSELSYYEAQRRLKEEHMEHMLMLQALDNAASYVGPSRGLANTQDEPQTEEESGFRQGNNFEETEIASQSWLEEQAQQIKFHGFLRDGLTNMATQLVEGRKELR
ncbi:hypothetical protein RND71_001487 [Anisodus tanguticus]|uniref:DC1 domain-containing protein n=1 Tax=Anisodus tanguticus TaxID=243964 RepID=A0AAE1T1H3_9SOLA|nr:hypothetical protein RND71_001487 [Anisodus tanguticus]